MDDNEKNVSSYQLDQEILDARGISMTVEEVAGLPACKYTERIRSLKLNAEDRSFLKGLRRRIKNRLASQNSRRRSMEHLRELARELRALRVCRDYALCERGALLSERDSVREQCRELRCYVVQVLQERSDPTEVPSIDVDRVELPNESPPKETPKSIESPKIVTVKETKTPLLPECFTENDKNIFECRIDKLVQQSVNHLYKTDPERDKKRVFAKTVFISNDKTKMADSDCDSDTPATIDKMKSAIEKTKKAIDNSRPSITSANTSSGKRVNDKTSLSLNETKLSLNDTKLSLTDTKLSLNDTKLSLNDTKLSLYPNLSVSMDKKEISADASKLDASIKMETDELDACLKQELGRGLNEGTVLNLSLKKESKRRSHGRKQSAPKRVAYVCMDTDVSDFVLDLKIKKENP